MTNRKKIAIGVVALVGLSALSAEAQVEQSRWQIVVGGGYQSYASGAAMEAGGSINAEANYFLSEMIGLGLYGDFTFTETDGTKLTPAALNFVDSTTFTFVNQGADIFQYGGQVKLRMPSDISLFALLGAGGYTLFLDPQQNTNDENVTNWMLKFGAGVDFAISPSAGFQLAVHDNFYPNWEPGRLLPVRSQFQNTRFPELNPDPGELSKSTHNFRFSLAVTLLPGAL